MVVQADNGHGRVVHAASPVAAAVDGGDRRSESRRGHVEPTLSGANAGCPQTHDIGPLPVGGHGCQHLVEVIQTVLKIPHRDEPDGSPDLCRPFVDPEPGAERGPFGGETVSFSELSPQGGAPHCGLGVADGRVWGATGGRDPVLLGFCRQRLVVVAEDQIAGRMSAPRSALPVRALSGAGHRQELVEEMWAG